MRRAFRLRLRRARPEFLAAPVFFFLSLRLFPVPALPAASAASGPPGRARPEGPAARGPRRPPRPSAAGCGVVASGRARPEGPVARPRPLAASSAAGPEGPARRSTRSAWRRNRRFCCCCLSGARGTSRPPGPCSAPLRTGSGLFGLRLGPGARPGNWCPGLAGTPSAWCRGPALRFAPGPPPPSRGRGTGPSTCGVPRWQQQQTRRGVFPRVPVVRRRTAARGRRLRRAWPRAAGRSPRPGTGAAWRTRHPPCLARPPFPPPPSPPDAALRARPPVGGSRPHPPEPALNA